MSKKKNTKVESPIDIMTPPSNNNQPIVEEPSEIVETPMEEEMISKKEYDELYKKYLMTAADFDNFVKRTKKNQSEMNILGSQKLLEKLIPALNTVYSSVKNSNDDGPRLIFKTLIDALKTADIDVIIPKVGDAFNGDSMNAIAAVPAPDESANNTIVDIMSPGYSISSKIIEYPKVVVYTNG